MQAYAQTGCRMLVAALLSCGLVVGLAAPVRAWSSKDIFLFEPVHQNAVDRVLRDNLPQAQIAQLQAAQAAADQDQEARDSQFHAMAGVLADTDLPNRRHGEYIGLAEQALFGMITDAQKARRAGNVAAAMDRLGRALHILTDATSPAHRCFQPWSYNEYLGDEIAHVLAERVTPDPAGADSDRARLDAAVRWGYDLYRSEQAPPTHYFDAVTGELQIPKQYGVSNDAPKVTACSGAQG